MYPEFTHLKSMTYCRLKQANLIVRLIPLESFELIKIHLNKCVQKGLKKCDYSIYTMTLPRKVLKKYDYNIDMEKKDLKKLTKGQLIKLLSKKVSNHEDLLDNDPFKYEVVQEATKPRTGKWESIKPKPVPRKSVNEDIILTPPKGFRDIPPKPTRAPPLPPNDGFNFDDDIFQTENTSLGKFKILGIRNQENKKFKRYTNEFRVKILKELDNDNEIFHIFQELVKHRKEEKKA